MYQDEKKVNIFKILLRIILFILIVILVYKLIGLVISNFKKKSENNVMENNLNKMQEVGIDYYKENKNNIEVGKNKVVYLNELIDSNKIEEIKDDKNNVCSKEQSYIEIMRMENEYRIKSYLVCDNITSDKFIYIDPKTDEPIKDQEPSKEVVIPTGDTTTTTKKVTTTTTKAPTTTTTKKKTTTTKKVTTTTVVTQPQVEKYRVSFNTNGGDELAPVEVVKGKTTNLPRPTRAGYTFYHWIDSNNNVYTDTITPDRNIVLIAKWR